MEEYTGIYAQYDPIGHRMADSLANVYKDNFFVINIHAGYYSHGYYNTTEGDTLEIAFGVNFVPSGSINREYVNPGCLSKGYVISRIYWSDATEQFMGMKASVNVAARTTINRNTRKLTCMVEAYFTDSSSVEPGENYINIARIQDNILGSQGGGQIYYLDMYDESTGKYKHNHMLRALITGVSGDAITTNTKGSFCTKTFSYDIPAIISDEEVILDNLRIIVFVSENDPTNALNVTDSKDVPRIINVCKSDIIFE